MVVGRGSPLMIILLARPGELVEHAEIELAEEEVHHFKVRRADAGQPVRLVDGAGNYALASVRTVGKGLRAQVGEVKSVPRGPECILGVAAGDKDRFGLVIEKAAELGVTRIIPLTTERSATVAPRIRSAQLPKLQRKALEAIKQSGALWAPGVAEPMSVFHFATAPRTGQAWLADAGGSPPPRAGSTEPVTVAIGPEGGFTTQEVRCLRDSGFTPVRLGPEILRFETAAIAAMSAAWLFHQESHD